MVSEAEGHLVPVNGSLSHEHDIATLGEFQNAHFLPVLEKKKKKKKKEVPTNEQKVVENRCLKKVAKRQWHGCSADHHRCWPP